MPRPRKPRCIRFDPFVTFFKPAGIPLNELMSATLTLEELESLRLKDVVGLDQSLCAEQMNISQTTFQRTLARARKTVSTAIISGHAIRIIGLPKNNV